MPASTPTGPAEILTGYSILVISVLDTGRHQTVGVMTIPADGQVNGVAAVVMAMTPDEARRLAAELVDFANR